LRAGGVRAGEDHARQNCRAHEVTKYHIKHQTKSSLNLFPSVSDYGNERESEDILANEGPPHQAFTTLPAEMQFQKVGQNAGLTRRNAPHNLAFHFHKPF
jgi:hypothetical protein